MNRALMCMVVAFISFFPGEAIADSDSSTSPSPSPSPPGRGTSYQIRGTAETGREMADANVAPKFEKSMGNDPKNRSTQVLESRSRRLVFCPDNIWGRLGWTAISTVAGMAGDLVGGFVDILALVVDDGCAGEDAVVTADLIDSIYAYVDDSIIQHTLDGVDIDLNGAANRLAEYWNPEDGETQQQILADLEEIYFEPLSQKLAMNATDDSTPFLAAPFGDFSHYPDPYSKKELIDKDPHIKQHMLMLSKRMTFEAMNLHLSFLILKSVFWKSDVNATKKNVRVYLNFANTYRHYLTYLFVKWAEGWREEPIHIKECHADNDLTGVRDCPLPGLPGCGLRRLGLWDKLKGFVNDLVDTTEASTNILDPSDIECTCTNRWCTYTDDLQCKADGVCGLEKVTFVDTNCELPDGTPLTRVMAANSNVMEDVCQAFIDDGQSKLKTEIAANETAVLRYQVASQLDMIHSFTSRLYAMHTFALKWDFQKHDKDFVKGCMGFSKGGEGATLTVSACAAKLEQQFIIDVVGRENVSDTSHGLWKDNLVVVIRSQMYQNLVITPHSSHKNRWYGQQKLREYEGNENQQWILLEDGRMMIRDSKSSPLCLAHGHQMYRCKWANRFGNRMYPYFEVTMTDP